jgi:hypothetical protein
VNGPGSDRWFFDEASQVEDQLRDLAAAWSDIRCSVARPAGKPAAGLIAEADRIGVTLIVVGNKTHERHEPAARRRRQVPVEMMRPGAARDDEVGALRYAPPVAAMVAVAVGHDQGGYRIPLVRRWSGRGSSVGRTRLQLD